METPGYCACCHTVDETPVQVLLKQPANIPTVGKLMLLCRACGHWFGHWSCCCCGRRYWQAYEYGVCMSRSHQCEAHSWHWAHAPTAQYFHVTMTTTQQHELLGSQRQAVNN